MHQKTPRSVAAALVLLFAIALICAANLVAAQEQEIEHNSPIPAVPHYVRLEIPSGAAVYVRFYKDQVSVASTLKGLRTAKSTSYIAPLPNDQIEFPEIDLPFNKADLPKGIDRLRACFVFSNSAERIGGSDPNSAAYGHINFITNITRSGNKESWGYLIQFYGQTSPHIKNPKLIRIASLKKIESEVSAMQMPETRDIAVTLRLKEVMQPYVKPVPLTPAGTPEYNTGGLIEVQKNGTTATVWVKITGPDGRIVAGKQGNVYDFSYG